MRVLPKLLLICCLTAVAGYTKAQTIVTVAGGIGNDTMAAPYGRLSAPALVIPDGAGGLYIKDDIGGYRRIDATTNRMTVTTGGGKGVVDAAGTWFYISSRRIYKRDVAGTVTHVAGNGLTVYVSDGVAATLAPMDPQDVTVDAAGNVYIADAINQRIRKVNTSGIISTYAGTGALGFSGDGANAMFAKLNDPVGVTVDAAGNLFIADRGNRRIRKVNTTGTISTYAGTSATGSTGDGGLATAATLTAPSVVRVDGSGNLYMVGGGPNKIRMINASGVINTIAGTGTAAYAGDGLPATMANLNNPVDIAIDAFGGGLYIADKDNNRIRYVNSSGMMSTFAGNGLPASGFGGDGGNAMYGVFNGLNGITVDNAGNLYIADAGNRRIRKVDAVGVLSTVAGNGSTGFAGDGGPATSASTGAPTFLTADKFGNFYFASDNNVTVRKVSPSGTVTVFAGGGSGTGDGIPATTAQIGTNIRGLSVDTAGNVYISDGTNKKVRKVDAATGVITTVAGSGSSTPSGDGGPATAAGFSYIDNVVLDKQGNMFIGGDPIRMVNASGIISSLPFSGFCLAVDTMGNIYMLDDIYLKRYDIYNYLSIISEFPLSGSMAINASNYLFFTKVNEIKKMGPLSTVIDYPPTFTKGASTIITVCISSTGNVIDTFLKVKDIDMGQTLTWTVISGPANGTLGGFPYAAASTGGVVVPGGMTYAPTTGYTGADVFKIKVSDGEDTAMITVNITVAATSTAGSLTGLSNVCKGASIALDASVWGGTWSMTNTNATINDTGLVTGTIGGVDTVVYTVNTYCGIRTATKTVTVNQITVPVIQEPLPAFCLNAILDLHDNALPNTGAWSIVEGPLQQIGGSMIKCIDTGAGIVAYSVTNECGIGRDSAAVNVLDKPIAGTITGPTTGCPGDGGMFASTMLGGKWYSSNSSVAFIDSVTGAMSINATGSTQIRYTTSNACGSSTATKSLNVPNAPSAGTINGSGTLCAGATTILTNTLAGGVWSTGDTLIATIDNSGAIKARKAGVVPVSYTITNGCGMGSAVAILNINPSPEVTPIAGKSLVIQGTMVTLRGRAPVGEWSSSDTTVASINQWGELTGVANGTATITYTETNSSNCSTIETMQVSVTSSSRVELNVYPIPANRIVNVGYKKSTALDADVQFTDVMGRVVSKSKIDMPSSSGVAQFDVSLLPAGVYTISIIAADGNYIGKLVVKH